MAVLVRLGGALGALGAVGWLLGRLAPPGDLPHRVASAPADEAVVELAAAAAWACLAWLTFVLVAVAAGAYPRGAVRDVAEHVLGVAVVGAAAGALVASPAVAADGPFDRPAGSPPSPGPRPAATAPPAAVSRPPTPAAPTPPASAAAPTPAAPTSPAASVSPATPVSPAAPADPADTGRSRTPGSATLPAPARAAAPTASPPAGGSYVVRPGDTLWGIAARRLGPAASPSLVAATWPRWYAANRPLLGPDPHRIRPGQRLVPPASHGDSR